MSGWWSAVPGAALPEDQFERDKAAATVANNAQCQAAIDAMRATAEAEMLKLLDSMSIESMAQA